MSRPSRWLLYLTFPVVAAVCFQNLLTSPGSLLVDGARPSLDYADRGGRRGVGNDLTDVALPRFVSVVRSAREVGALPLWDSSGFGGRPLVGNPQAGLFYPGYWVALAVGHPAVLGWLTVAHLIGAGVGAYRLSRLFGLCRPASAFAGGCFQASPYLIGHTFEGHYPHVWAVSWYPWAFWALVRAGRGGRAGFWLLPVFLALAFLTGHPQEWYLLVLALGAWAAADVYRDVRGGRTDRAVGRALGGMLILAASLAFCGVELLPDLAATPWLLRTSGVSLAEGNRYFVHSVNLLQLLDPYALGRPWEYFGHDNYWESVVSIGLAPLVLAWVGACRHRDRVVARRLVWLVAVSLVFAGGRRLGLSALAAAVLPGMDRFRVPSRTLFLASLSASVLAGAGVHELLRGGLSEREWAALRVRLRRALVGLGLSVLVLGTAGAVVGLPGPRRRGSPEGGEHLSARAVKAEENAVRRSASAVGSVAREPVFWFSLVGMAACVSASYAARGGQASAAWGLSAIGLAELSLHARSLLVCAPVSAFLGSEPALSELAREAAGAGRPVRVASVGALVPDFAAAVMGLEKANVNDSFQVGRAAWLYQQLYPFLDPLPRRPRAEAPMDRAVEARRAGVARAVLDVMGVDIFVSDRDVSALGLAPSRGREAGTAELRVCPGNDLGWGAKTGSGRLPPGSVPLPRRSTRGDRDSYLEDSEPVPDVPGSAGRPGQTLTLWRNPGALPRAYVVPNAVVVRDQPAALLAALWAGDPRAGVFMAVDPLAGSARQSYRPAEWSPRGPDAISVRVETEAPGLLVVANTWMPGWTATVDGRPAVVARGNGCQQVVALPDAGAHEVVLTYRTPGLDLGIVLTAVGVAGWAGLGAVLAVRSLRGSDPRGQAVRLAYPRPRLIT